MVAVPMPAPRPPWGATLGLGAVLGTFIVLGSAALALFTILAIRFMWALIVLPPLPSA